MMATRLDTSGLDEILSRMPGRKREILGTAAYEVESGAKQRAPIKTGALYNSLNTTATLSGDVWTVSDGVEYGIFQEMGTSKMPAHPFLVPAVEAVRQAFVDKWKELFK